MSLTIWKAVLKLTARDQHEQLCVWFKCDPDSPITKRRIAIVGTGYPTPDNARYVGTGFLSGGQLVFHIFEQAALH